MYRSVMLLNLQCVSECVVDNLSLLFFFFKQKTAYELRISDWSSDVCSSDLSSCPTPTRRRSRRGWRRSRRSPNPRRSGAPSGSRTRARSEEHTSELQLLLRISYAVFCMKKKH